MPVLSRNPPQPLPSSSTSPTPAELGRAKTVRASFISRLTQFPTKNVSVVPYAPERLSITQNVLTPTMQEALLQAQNARQDPAMYASMKNPSDRDVGTRIAHSSPAEEPRGEEKMRSSNTLFAAFRMRRALHRAKAGRETHEQEPKIDETQANINRHIKVLSRYKIRRVDIAENETTKLKDIGFFMVNPHSTIFKMWQLSTLIIIIYQSILLPYSLAFGWNQNPVIDTVTNLIFFTDILIAFNTPIAASDDESEYICDRLEIAKIYCRGWLFFDLLACLPFDNIIVWINNYDSSGSSSSNLNVLGLLKALRIPRLLRLVRLLRVVKVLKIRPEIRRWLLYSRHANLLRLVRLVLSFLILNHYAACIWFGAVASEQSKAQISNHDPLHLYIVSFYTTLLVIQGQNLDVLYTDGEYIFCIAAMLFGAIVMAVVFGNVAILIANYYENQSSHQKKMEWLFSSMTRMKLPMDLQNRINDYYQAMWERHGTLDGAVTAFIPELSRNLAYEVELFLRMDMINRAPIFQNCSAKVVQELVMELELQVFMPGDYIVVRGEVGNDMYFVQNGVCEVTKDLQAAAATAASYHHLRRGTIDESANEIILKTLYQGDYFGEIALLMNCKRTANVRALVFSELCALTREVFENISMRYLEDRTIIEKFIMDKYDPSMLQAAMKQSQDVAMRGNASPSAAHASRPVEETDGVELLRHIDERLERLEQRIDRESKDRRDSEIRMAVSGGGPRLSTHSEDSSHGHGHRRAMVSNNTSDFVLYEPERMSQRHLELLPLPRGSSKAAQITEIIGVQNDATLEGDGAATEDHTDQKRNVWRRPSIHRAGSWRNARREGSADSLRLRGLAKPLAATNTRHSSRAASLTAAITAAETVSVQHSSLGQEPSLRVSVTLTDQSIEGGHDHQENEVDEESDGRDRGLLSADSLDALADTLAQSEQREVNSPPE